jgi:hypothetical protein
VHWVLDRPLLKHKWLLTLIILTIVEPQARLDEVNADRQHMRGILANRLGPPQTTGTT